MSRLKKALGLSSRSTVHVPDVNYQVGQVMLTQFYQDLVRRKQPLPGFRDVGFRVRSQCDEDGILLYLFAVAGTTSKTFVEVGTGDARECNCANLAINRGWHGLFIDGNDSAIESGREFYSKHPDTLHFPPALVASFVTRDNINDLIRDAGFTREVDLLSIDIDGMDYWIWDAIVCINPRVVVVEANGKLGDRSITVPYDPNWTYNASHPHYHGASLPAFVNLANGKGYRLVGANRFGFNAFFVRNDVAADLLPAVSIASCRTHPTRLNDERFFAAIRDLPWVEVAG
jgi:hypothetical protein